jgi:glutathione S-transferase
MLLGFLNLDCNEVAVDLWAGEHKRSEYLSINPLGQVPALLDGDVILHDSQAILVYLARSYGGEAFLPSDPAQMGAVMQWLSFAANEIHQGPNLARLHFLLGVPVDIERARAQAKAALKILDERLRSRAWLELDRPTIADIACFPYAALAPQGKVELDDYPNVRAWIDRIKALPRYRSMPGLEAPSSSAST